ncbi:MAG: hypothetical protein JXR95_07660 [Deltaproteobacteria bacterium]|nr:hypothetical protein [Deltaproteobacteria bacterium]
MIYLYFPDNFSSENISLLKSCETGFSSEVVVQPLDFNDDSFLEKIKSYSLVILTAEIENKGIIDLIIQHIDLVYFLVLYNDETLHILPELVNGRVLKASRLVSDEVAHALEYSINALKILSIEKKYTQRLEDALVKKHWMSEKSQKHLERLKIYLRILVYSLHLKKHLMKLWIFSGKFLKFRGGVFIF